MSLKIRTLLPARIRKTLESPEFRVFCISSTNYTPERIIKLFTITAIVFGFFGALIGFFLQNVLYLLFLPISIALMTREGLLLLLLRQYEDAIIKVDSKGYLALNEFIVVLDTTRSLEDGLYLLALEDYPVISEISRKTLEAANLGDPLLDAFKENIEMYGYGKIKGHLLRVCEIWAESSDSIALFADNIAEQVRSRFKEENEKISAWGSLYSGIGGLLGPILACILLVTGSLNFPTAILLCAFLLIVAVALRPWKRFEDILAESVRKDVAGSSVIYLLGEYLQSGLPFEMAFHRVLTTLRESIPDQRELFTQLLTRFSYGIFPEDKFLYEKLSPIINKGTIKILLLGRQFATIDAQVAGRRLTRIASTIQLNETIVAERVAKLSSEKARLQILQYFSSATLGFLAAMSPMFIFISNITAINLGTMLPETVNQIEVIYAGIQLFALNLVGTRFPAGFSMEKQEKLIGKISQAIVVALPYIIIFGIVFLGAYMLVSNWFPSIFS
ncbi:MAG: hypothetical protein ACFFCZ_05175 [Promethearchaeota archaeon]